MQYILSANPPTQLQLKLTIELNDISLSLKSFILLCYKIIVPKWHIHSWTLLWLTQLSSSSNLWSLLDVCGTNVLPAQYWHMCVTLHRSTSRVILSMQIQSPLLMYKVLSFWNWQLLLYNVSYSTVDSHSICMASKELGFYRPSLQSPLLCLVVMQ